MCVKDVVLFKKKKIKKEKTNWTFKTAAARRLPRKPLLPLVCKDLR